MSSELWIKPRSASLSSSEQTLKDDIAKRPVCPLNWSPLNYVFLFFGYILSGTINKNERTKTTNWVVKLDPAYNFSWPDCLF